MKKQSLPDLPYDYSALEPVISGEIMELHHKKHHQAYVNNLNAALEKSAAAEASEDLSTLVKLQPAIRFNGGGHINHSLFWTSLAPKNKGGGSPPEGELLKAINENFGSFDLFIEKFNTQTAAIQGSGWGWLAQCPESGMIFITQTANQDPLLGTQGFLPLLGIDVWEHAYYLQYKNARPDYLKAIWGVVNWKEVAARFKQGCKKSESCCGR